MGRPTPEGEYGNIELSAVTNYDTKPRNLLPYSSSAGTASTVKFKCYDANADEVSPPAYAGDPGAAAEYWQVAFDQTLGSWKTKTEAVYGVGSFPDTIVGVSILSVSGADLWWNSTGAPTSGPGTGNKRAPTGIQVVPVGKTTSFGPVPSSAVLSATAAAALVDDASFQTLAFTVATGGTINLVSAGFMWAEFRAISAWSTANLQVLTQLDPTGTSTMGQGYSWRKNNGFMADVGVGGRSFALGDAGRVQLNGAKVLQFISGSTGVNQKLEVLLTRAPMAHFYARVLTDNDFREVGSEIIAAQMWMTNGATGSNMNQWRGYGSAGMVVQCGNKTKQYAAAAASSKVSTTDAQGAITGYEVTTTGSDIPVYDGTGVTGQPIGIIKCGATGFFPSPMPFATNAYINTAGAGTQVFTVHYGQSIP